MGRNHTAEMSRHPRSADHHFVTIFFQSRGKLRRLTGRPVRGENPRRKSNAEMIENFECILQDRQIAFAAHDDSDNRLIHILFYSTHKIFLDKRPVKIIPRAG